MNNKKLIFQLDFIAFSSFRFYLFVLDKQWFFTFST